MTWIFFIAPEYDDSGSWQATGSDLLSNDVLRWVDTNSYETQHYIFLAGSDYTGPLGIAWLGTPCLTLPDGI